MKAAARRPRRHAAATMVVALGVVLALLTGCAVQSANRTTRTGTASRTAPKPAAKRPAIEGRYAINGKRNDIVVITHLGGNRYRVENPGFWDGVGFFDGKTYWGVFRYPDDSRHTSLTKAVGLHRATLQSNRSFKVHGSFTGDGFGEFDVEWVRL